MPGAQIELLRHQDVLVHCRRCPRVQSTPVIGNPVLSRVLLVGQAPGPREPDIGKPFAWTAGKMLFKWFGGIGLDEDAFRARVYMAAVCRCFPGKNPGGGDRVPAPDEIENCSEWLDRELAILKPKLVIAVGKLAIQRFLAVGKLDESSENSTVRVTRHSRSISRRCRIRPARRRGSTCSRGRRCSRARSR